MYVYLLSPLHARRWEKEIRYSRLPAKRKKKGKESGKKTRRDFFVLIEKKEKIGA